MARKISVSIQCDIDCVPTEEEEKIIKKSTTTETTHHTVKTGDYTNTVPYLVAAGISGLVLLALAIYSLHERNRQRGGKA